jgi:hypothetical protein
MTAPLTDQQLAEITARHEYGDEEFIRHCETDMAAVLAEVARLRADLTQARAAAPLLVDREDLTELAAILDAERYRLDKGDGSPVPQPRWGANVRVSQAVQAALAGEDPPRPSPEHSAVYMDGDRQVWSEYKTVPESDAVLSLVWAAEKTSSRAALADEGVDLRVVGWIR